MRTIVHARSQVPDGVFAIGADPVRLTWRVTGADPDARQEAYQIEASSADDFEPILAASGEIAGAAQVGIVAPGDPLDSREVRFYRVRIRTGSGWTAWSDTVRVEAGLLHAHDWQASAITLPDDPGSEHQAPSPVLRREFEVGGPIARARLYVTSLGIHEVRINGRPVTDALLSPGWTAYRHRILSETHDVTSLLAPGRNAVAATLGDGWYRGRLGWDPGDDRRRYGDQLGLVAQLEVELVDGTRQVILTDESWVASTAEVLTADLYDGCRLDLRECQAGFDLPGFGAASWVPVRVVPFDRSLLQPRMAPPVRVVAELPVGRTARPDDTLQLDGGQNISGYVRLRVKGGRGARVTVRHAEVLEPDGSLHTLSLRSAKATDTYILADDEETVLEPRLTFHGFRYAEVESEAEVLEATFVAISSDTPPRASFACSHRVLERFHENVVWSQRDNFVSVPTDCPQRDERLGWTGDAQAFAATGSTLFEAESFWASWLRDLALDQDDELGVPTVVPDVVVTGGSRFGRAGWADAATIVPWAVYESYGDAAVVRDQLDSMRRWIASLQRRLGADGMLPASIQFGDWLDPDAPIDRPWEAKTDSTYLANAFLVRSARLAAAASELAGDGAWAAQTRTLADAVASKTWARWAGTATSTQTGCALALRFGLVPSSKRGAVADALARLVREAGGRVSSGFLGTPLVLPALSDAGRFEEAYLMLLREEMPSWLYQVRQGATTVWERWDAIRPDGSIHPGTMKTPPEMADRKEGEPHMLSFNHYAYGAVIDWVYRNVAGIATEVERPGYQHVVLAPRPSEAITWARATVESAYGAVAIDWRIDGAGVFRMEVDLPFGTSGTFFAPATTTSRVEVDGTPARALERVPMGPGHHAATVQAPHIVVAQPGVVSR